MALKLSYELLQLPKGAAMSHTKRKTS